MVGVWDQYIDFFKLFERTYYNIWLANKEVRRNHDCIKLFTSKYCSDCYHQRKNLYREFINVFNINFVFFFFEYSEHGYVH